MAYLHTVDVNDRLVTVSGHGGEILAEATESTSRLMADPRIDAHFRILIIGDSRAPAPLAEDIARIADLLTVLRRRILGRIAIVPTTCAHAASANLIAVLGSKPTLGGSEEVRTFRTEQEAREWLRGSAHSRNVERPVSA